MVSPPRCSDVALWPCKPHPDICIGCSYMDAYGGQARMAAYLRDHHDKVVGRWVELVVAGIRGRMSPDEVRHELEDFYALLLRVMTGQDEHATGELHASLDQLSRSRARNGF